MLKLKFVKFLEELKKARRTKNPTIHYLEDETEFKILFKNYEFWEYYTIVDKSMIIAHGESNDISADDSVSDFRMEYLYHAVELEKKAVEEIIETETFEKSVSEKNNPYANSPMEKSMLEQIEKSKDKLEEALKVLL